MTTLKNHLEVVKKLKYSLMDKHGKEAECVALQFCLSLLQDLQQIDEGGIVPKEKKRYFVVGAQDSGHWIELNSDDYAFNACRSQTIANLLKIKEKIEEVIEKYLYEFQAEVIQWKNDKNYYDEDGSQIEIPPIEEKRKFYIERIKSAIWQLIIGKENKTK